MHGDVLSDTLAYMYMYIIYGVGVCIGVTSSTYIYIYIYIHTHTSQYIYIYICTSIHKEREREMCVLSKQWGWLVQFMAVLMFMINGGMLGYLLSGENKQTVWSHK